ncbi:MAG: FMN-binding protein [Microbacterium sp. 71-36]|uniref:FMN-binding protein n=1 Tax=unclassified Microbacterium TaxID=2609290 RepID=UPI0008696401|nr:MULTISPECIES: FMN-binding protein [unclassified Microbacterium]MBN9210876.1 FMN-binding protein [Microbacterium sp.]ODT37241.1 MAG: FMN-binding protein [Microbacterium sp. SCN 71-17]OJV75635.1 MAG: FMN-binding protein [Microbacterium sp. 71-36]
MKKIFYAVMATLTGLVLLFSYRTSLGEGTETAAALPATTPAPASAQRATPSASTSPSASASPSGAAPSAATPTQAAPASSGLADGTFTGSSVNTRFGPVQVQITVSGGSVTDVQVPVYPSENGRDQQINSRALPVLVKETLDAQSADIDMVSGATYTSTGYLKSLQSALDEARA